MKPAPPTEGGCAHNNRTEGRFASTDWTAKPPEEGGAAVAARRSIDNQTNILQRAEKSTRQTAEQAAQRLRELLSRGTDSPRSERHHAKYLYRQSSDSAAVLSHLHFELDGLVSAEYQTALVAEFEHCLATAREAGPAFSMLSEHDRMPTVHWSAGLPARVCVDIYTTGGAKLWAFEHLVQTCFEKAVDGCEVGPRRRADLAPERSHELTRRQ